MTLVRESGGRDLTQLRVLVALACLLMSVAGANAQPATTQAAPAAAITGLFPHPGAKGVCPDTRLRITFSAAPVIGTGAIKIYDASNDSVVDSIDVAAPKLVRTIGTLPNFSYHPVIIDGNEAVLWLADHALSYGKNYYVKIDPGAFKNSNGNAVALIYQASEWRFGTKSAPPVAGATRLIVAADGSGDFASVQGALDYLPQGNTTATTIFIRNGLYNEIICFLGKNNVTLLGEDRQKTIIAYPNNDRFNNNAGGNPFATSTSAPSAGTPTTAPAHNGGAIYRRGLLLGHHVKGLVIANLTLHNTTPQGGSQAEAIILNGATDAHAILTDVDLYSFQDTLQINGQAYLSNCFIQGDVDFMWGTGPVFFDHCHAKSVRSNAYYTQIRNPGTNHGFIYKDCIFDGAPGISGGFLSRIVPARFPFSEVVLLNCVISNAVGPVAWRIQRTTQAPNIHFWEFNSHSADDKPVDVSKRMPLSKQLKLPDDKELIDNYSDPTFVLGGKWTPALCPIIASQPESVETSAGQMVTFKVNAVGVPAVSYQWEKNGADIAGATEAIYEIPSASSKDAGKYSVMISNSAGKVISDAAKLSVGGS
jgi:pectin methylesterase-like acyl-CoA thioesterase